MCSRLNVAIEKTHLRIVGIFHLGCPRPSCMCSRLNVAIEKTHLRIVGIFHLGCPRPSCMCTRLNVAIEKTHLRIVGKLTAKLMILFFVFRRAVQGLSLLF